VKGPSRAASKLSLDRGHRLEEEAWVSILRGVPCRGDEDDAKGFYKRKGEKHWKRKLRKVSSVFSYEGKLTRTRGQERILEQPRALAASERGRIVSWGEGKAKKEQGPHVIRERAAKKSSE